METLGQDTITIVNEWVEEGAWLPPFPPGPDVTKYQNTVVKFGQWEDTTELDTNNLGRSTIKSVTIFIPLDAQFTNKRKYMRNEDFVKLPPDQKENYFTLKTKTAIFLGEVPPISSLYSITQARQDFTNVIIEAINNYSNNDIIPHFELVGI